jgi:hypothetical protein
VLELQALIVLMVLMVLMVQRELTLAALLTFLTSQSSESALLCLRQEMQLQLESLPVLARLWPLQLSL